MASSDATYFNRPTSGPSCEQLVKYILQAEIITTARSGAYSGTVCSSTNTFYNYCYLCRSTASTVFSWFTPHYHTAACGEGVHGTWLWYSNPTSVNQARCEGTSNALDVGKIKHKIKSPKPHNPSNTTSRWVLIKINNDQTILMLNELSTQTNKSVSPWYWLHFYLLWNGEDGPMC